LFFLDVTSTAIDNDTAMNTVTNTSNDGNSAIVGEGSEVLGVFVVEVNGLGVDCEPVVVGVGLGLFVEIVGLGLGLFVEDGLTVLLAEL
jgi:hypothetical protein